MEFDVNTSTCRWERSYRISILAFYSPAHSAHACTAVKGLTPRSIRPALKKKKKSLFYQCLLVQVSPGFERRHSVVCLSLCPSVALQWQISPLPPHSTLVILLLIQPCACSSKLVCAVSALLSLVVLVISVGASICNHSWRQSLLSVSGHLGSCISSTVSDPETCRSSSILLFFDLSFHLSLIT